ncbi:hypothetical protein DDZ13_02845 [Coraliomargarita sinensis]|uniref:DUF4381 domain-containing protein n=1 Tax=Coraliomargarita sinensis TaxID=2174842 RepID=A0A317ZM76_9BACT|nr:DUF4381 family protein [Coraliomargarita sinensis]PXA04919.1 hypothetical protein DDZ13_02845 [Coraliomargarita sinensis]
MFPIAQSTAPQLPALPDGPGLENVRGPIEVNGGYEIWQIVLAAVAILVIVGGFIWLYRRSKNRAPTPVDPHTAALAELDAASQAADDERYAMLCANAVRRYMEACLGLPVTSKTSAEAIARLPMPPEEKTTLHDFLENCDGVKFARRTLSDEQRIELMDTAKHLVDNLKKKEATDQP